MTAPFGIEFYSAVTDLQVVQDVGQGKFFISAPKAHPAFEQYVVQATPRLGVVWIKAIAPVLDNDAYGARVRQAQGDLRIQLEKRYGPGKTTDFLMTGSIWDEDRYWTQGLSANERHYFTTWEKPSAQLPRGPDERVSRGERLRERRDQLLDRIFVREARRSGGGDQGHAVGPALTATSTAGTMMVTCRNACSLRS